MNRKYTVFLLAALLPLAAQANASARSDIGQELDDARQEVSIELAQARAQLDSENLSLGDGLHFGNDSKDDATKRETLPKAEITPKGDLLIEDTAVAIDTAQRGQLLAYRGEVIELAKIGIDAGEKAANAAFEITDVSMFRLIVGGMTGSLERRVEAMVEQEIQPMVLQICSRLPQLHASQQALAASLPEFQPYATLEADDAADCQRDIRQELASR